MFGIFRNSDKRNNVAAEGCGHDDTATHFKFNSLGDHPNKLDQHNKAMVGFSLCSCLFTQDKVSPLKHEPLVIELDLVRNATECLNAGHNRQLPPVAYASAWVPEHTQIKCDIVALDSELQHSNAAHLLSARTLPIDVRSYATDAQHAHGKEKRYIVCSFRHAPQVGV